MHILKLGIITEFTLKCLGSRILKAWSHFILTRVHKPVMNKSILLPKVTYISTHIPFNLQVQWRSQSTHSNFQVLHYVWVEYQSWAYVCGVIANIGAGGDNQPDSSVTLQDLADVNSVLVVPAEGNTYVMSWVNALPALIVSDSGKSYEKYLR